MIQIAIMGLGTVGTGVAKVVEANAAQISRKLGESLAVKTVLVRHFREGAYRHLMTDDFEKIASDPEIRVVVETIGGVEAAYEYTKRALMAGKHVVTANKQLVAEKGCELLALAKAKNVNYLFEASVGGGIPILHPLTQCMAANRIDEVYGILNGTTNYILTRMIRTGAGFADALKEAQEKGYAEADPTADVEGLDARRKLVLSANLAFGVSVREEDIPCVGISSITAQDIAQAGKKELIFKLIARAERHGGKVAAFVCPTLFPASAPEAHTGGTGNIVTFCAKRFGTQSFSGAGAGGYPTGSSVLADCLDIADGCKSFYVDRFAPCRIDLSGCDACWLYRANGEYFTCKCSAAHAFERYEQFRKEDSHALLARIAGDAAEELC